MKIRIEPMSYVRNKVTLGIFFNEKLVNMFVVDVSEASKYIKKEQQEKDDEEDESLE